MKKQNRNNIIFIGASILAMGAGIIISVNVYDLLWRIVFQSRALYQPIEVYIIINSLSISSVLIGSVLTLYLAKLLRFKDLKKIFITTVLSYSIPTILYANVFLLPWFIRLSD